LHWESHGQSMLPQQVDGLHDIVCSLCEIAHDKLIATSLLNWRSQSRGKNGRPTGFPQILHAPTPAMRANCPEFHDNSIGYRAFPAELGTSGRKRSAADSHAHPHSGRARDWTLSGTSRQFAATADQSSGTSPQVLATRRYVHMGKSNNPCSLAQSQGVNRSNK
jgi:hypothetical protein